MQVRAWAARRRYPAHFSRIGMFTTAKIPSAERVHDVSRIVQFSSLEVSKRGVEE